MDDWHNEAIDNDFYREEELDCPTCKGTGRVNPLTPNLPKDFLCLGADECPACEGSGICP